MQQQQDGKIMKLKELFEKVKERNLSKEQLGFYRDELANLAAQIQLELADLKKEEALYILNNAKETAISTKTAWNGTDKGQRLIELSHYYKATEKILSSLKSRLYEIY